MLRALTIVAAVAALAVSAAPASAGTKPPPRGAAGFFLDIGTTETLDLNAAPPRPRGIVVTKHTDSPTLKQITDGTSNTIARSKGRPNGIIAILIG